MTLSRKQDDCLGVIMNADGPVPAQTFYEAGYMRSDISALWDKAFIEKQIIDGKVHYRATRQGIAFWAGETP